MLSAILQLTGALLLGIMTAVRKSNEVNKRLAPIVHIAGQVHPRVLEIYKEINLFRIGLLFVAVGYLLQIVNLDINIFVQFSILTKILFTILIIIILSFASICIVNIISKIQLSKTKPFNPDEGPFEKGQVMIAPRSYGEQQKWKKDKE